MQINALPFYVFLFSLFLFLYLFIFIFFPPILSPGQTEWKKQGPRV